MLLGALRFLDIHINAMKSVQSQISHRKDVKLEFDRYEQKLSKMRKRKDGRPSQQRLERNEQKLQKARVALQTVTFDLYRVFAKYESERDTMLNGELEMVRQVMHNFYAKNADATNFSIPGEVDHSVVDSRAEQLFKGHGGERRWSRMPSSCSSQQHEQTLRSQSIASRPLQASVLRFRARSCRPNPL